MSQIKYFDNLKKTDQNIIVVWHARGNQGAIGAAEILAKLALRAKCFATSFGIFGAEKAGAPIMGFNRIGPKPIEAYYAPNRFDLIVILDPTVAGVTQGSHGNTIYIVNTDKGPEEIARELKLGPTRVIAVDATGIAKKIMPKGFQYPNTAMLGAVMHAFPYFNLELLKKEISAAPNFVEKGDKVISVNTTAAEMGFAGAKEFDGRGTDVPKAPAFNPPLPTWSEFEPAGAIIHAGNVCEKNTGTWRTERPIRNRKCTDCMLCYQFCPDFAIIANPECDKILGIDYDHCKGCGICKEVCEYFAIGMIPEAKAQRKDKEQKEAEENASLKKADEEEK